MWRKGPCLRQHGTSWLRRETPQVHSQRKRLPMVVHQEEEKLRAPVWDPKRGSPGLLCAIPLHSVDTCYMFVLKKKTLTFFFFILQWMLQFQYAIVLRPLPLLIFFLPYLFLSPSPLPPFFPFLFSPYFVPKYFFPPLSIFPTVRSDLYPFALSFSLSHYLPNSSNYVDRGADILITYTDV